MECTFVDDATTPENALEFGHMHIRHLLDNIEAFRDVGHVMLIHFSARYKRQEIVEHTERQLPDWFKAKCTLLLEGYA